VIHAAEVADAINLDYRDSAPTNASEARAVRKRWTAQLRPYAAEDAIEIALGLLEDHGHRFLPYELIRFHPAALARVDRALAERLGSGMSSWGDVDMFAVLVAGQAWRRVQISDDTIHDWARSDDRWWRRAALVATVPLNVRAQGGSGAPQQTFAVCSFLIGDRDEMVVKGMSWALREVVVHDAAGVRAFLDQYGPRLAARVRREVSTKLATGLKVRN